MITLKLMGGLGNQMFQYAAARTLSLAYKTRIVFNTEYFDNLPKGDTPRIYQLDMLNIPAPTFERSTSKMSQLFQKITRKFVPEKLQHTVAGLMLRAGLPARLTGYFQTETYAKTIRPLLLEEFKITRPLSQQTQDLMLNLGSKQSVCLNVRRSDYLRPDYIKLYGLCSPEYYKAAIAYMQSHIDNPVFCIISDDPEWVKAEFAIEHAIYAGSDLFKDYEQMALMSSCKHNIIANSSFAWWGAWLNQNPEKIVIAPRQWYVAQTADELGILPKEWVQM